MSALAIALLGIGAVLAERGLRAGRTSRARAALVATASAGTSRRSSAIDLRSVAIPVGVGAAGFVLWGLGGSAVGVGLAIGARRFGARRSRRTIEVLRDEQLADTVGAIASAVRAGMSVPQALAYAADEVDEPLSLDLRALVDDLGVGVPLGHAIPAWCERIGSDDARLLGSALDLHRRSGGDLPLVLDQVAGTIRERIAAAREIRALTAQARLSGLILGLLPVGFFAFLWLTSRRDIEGALSTPTGLISVGLGLVMEGFAFLWIRKLLEIA
jgi:tight adherence protein B